MSNKPVNIDINQIKDPSFVKNLNKKELLALSDAIRQEILKATSLYGGHLSSNLGTVELTIALYRAFSFPQDKLIIDVGHQCYTHKILTGRKLDNLGKEGYTSRFLDMEESPYDVYDSGHSSTSLSIAEGFAIARDLNREKYEVVALIGDGSIANGLAFEALNDIGSRQNKMIIVLNDNAMSISRSGGALSNLFRKISTARFYNSVKTKYKNALLKTKFGKWLYKISYNFKTFVKRLLIKPFTPYDTLGFALVGPVNGHDFKALDKAFKRAKNASRPVIVLVSTSKGKGYPFAENDVEGDYHSVSPFSLEEGHKPTFENGVTSYPFFFGSLTKKALEEDSKRLLIAPAMVKGSHLEESFKAFPERCFDVGIAEEHALTLASSFSLNGFHPIVSIYSTFLQRAFDELFHDCARKKCDMTLLIDRAGLSGCDGETHMGIYDESYLKSIPNLSLWMPSSLNEGEALFQKSFIKGQGIFAIRYPNALDKYSKTKDLENIACPFSYYLKNSQKASSCLLVVGPKGRLFSDFIKEKGYQGDIIIVRKLFPIEKDLISLLANYKALYLYDIYGTKEGFLESIEKEMFISSLLIPLTGFTLPNDFIKHGSKQEQEKRFNLDFESIASKIIALEKKREE